MNNIPNLIINLFKKTYYKWENPESYLDLIIYS